jgi:hypothetical protein
VIHEGREDHEGHEDALQMMDLKTFVSFPIFVCFVEKESSTDMLASVA